MKITNGERLVGLERALDRSFHTYSSGMKQRLAIARGLMSDPEILFMDEPSRNLDPVLAADLRSFIKHTLIQERAKSVVLATHNPQEAEDICHRVLILHRGRIGALGSLDQIIGKIGLRQCISVELEWRDGEFSVDRLPELLSPWNVSQVKQFPSESGLNRTGLTLDADTARIDEIRRKLQSENIVMIGFSRENVQLDQIIRSLE